MSDDKRLDALERKVARHFYLLLFFVTWVVMMTIQVVLFLRDL